MQKLLINSVSQRDHSAQETYYILLQLPMFKSSRDFVVLSLDGSRALEPNIEAQAATVPSILDRYLTRPSTSPFNDMTLLTFAKSYSMPKELSSEPTKEEKM